MRAAVPIAALLAGCAAFSPPPSGGKPQAARHPDRAFAIDYAGTAYVVDIRFIDVLGESVIAVRRGSGEGERTRLEVRPSRTPPEAGRFSDEAYRRVAVDIADAIAGRPPICADGQTMRLARGEDKAARTLYRSQREAWVVFAFCPAAPGGRASE